MTFCSRYLEDVETRLNRPSRNAGLTDHNLAKTYLFQNYGEPIGKVEIAHLDDRSWVQAHRYVLFHHDSIKPLRNARDSNPIDRNVKYYGLLTDIIELDYYGKWKVVLFQYDWTDVNTARGIKKDQFGFTMERFALEVSDNYVKKVLGKKWRDHKSALKKEYSKKNISLKEKLRNVLPEMLRYQWEDAVRFWNSKKGEDREQVGTTSRQKQKFTHTAGLKSFAYVAEAEVSKLLNLKRRQHREKLRFKENMKNSSYNLKRRQQRGKQSKAENTTHSGYNFKI
ncbi:hypothetical protein J1N35_044189 [Gossypium stocksii]|uniref:DUF4216 domain-containing protein n=1 Tax=Gossypium stocksii TaxID=47602 RepID=A0A9D3ZFS0_9ROSI|nr:hypothetical protein J1N35_044189 [Gossypium stocksii]